VSDRVIVHQNGHVPAQRVERSAQLTALLGREIVALSTQVYRHGLRALVLTGSLARAEGTFVRTGDDWELFGDADVLAVFHSGVPLPAKADLDLVARKIQDRLQKVGLRATPTLAAVHPTYLRRLAPSIFAYELAQCGQVLYGDPSVLSLVPAFAPAKIPLLDAWRLLANRIVEQLHAVRGAEVTPASSDGEYRTVKLYLDMATSLLVFVGAYAPTYQARAAALAALRAEDFGAQGGLPFPLPGFAEDVAAATRWKVRPDGPLTTDPVAFWERGVGYAQTLWQWQLARLVRPSAVSAGVSPMRELMRRQPLAARIKGWARVVRSRGWVMSAHHWPRWIRQARESSPRYLVYSAATSLLFMLPQALSGAVSASAVRDSVAALQALLPVSSTATPNGDATPWVRLAADIVANYDEFLVNSVD